MLIYKVTNLVNGKLYIGKTSGKLSTRKTHHLYYSKKNNGKCSPILGAAIRKYGPESFSFEQIGRFDDAEITSLAEQLFISEFNTQTPNGYNISAGGDGGSYSKSPETRAKISATLKAKSAEQSAHASRGWELGRTMPACSPEKAQRISEAKKHNGVSPKMRKYLNTRDPLTGRMVAYV